VEPEPEVTDEGPAEEVWAPGAARRVGESLPRVALAGEGGAPALVIRANGDPAGRADAVADALLKVVACDRAGGGPGFARDRSREVAQPGAFVLILVPAGPAGPEAEARLRAIAEQVAAEQVTAPGVSVEVIPAA
jgi:hypothetical protein